MGPPKASHRNSSRPKHERAKITMAAMRPKEGVLLTTRPPFLLRGARAQAAAVGAVEQVDERAELRVGLRDRVQQLARLAAEDHEAVADRPVASWVAKIVG